MEWTTPKHRRFLATRPAPHQSSLGSPLEPLWRTFRVFACRNMAIPRRHFIGYSLATFVPPLSPTATIQDHRVLPDLLYRTKLWGTLSQRYLQYTRRLTWEGGL